MKKARLKFALVCILLMAASRAQALVNVEVGLGGVQYEPEGNFGYKGIVLDAKSDLGYDKIKRFTGRVKISVPIIPSFYLQANPMNFEGTGSKNINFQFGDRVFTAGVMARVRELRPVDLSWRIFVRWALPAFALSVGGFILALQEVREPQTPSSETIVLSDADTVVTIDWLASAPESPNAGDTGVHS